MIRAYKMQVLLKRMCNGSSWRGLVISLDTFSRWFSRWRHLLFHCPTFWRLKPAFSCPICGESYRCYWDGGDIGGEINVCCRCAEKYSETGSF